MFFLGYHLPRSINILSSSGPLYNPDVLVDRVPKTTASFLMPSGAQTLGTIYTYTAQVDWNGGYPPRVGALLATTLPVGTKVQIFGIAAVGGADVPLGGNSLTARVSLFSDGSRGVKWRFSPSLAKCIGYRLTVFNDVNSVPSLPSGSYQSIGDVVFAPAVTFQVEKGRKKTPMPGQAPTRQMGGSFTQSSRYTAARLTVQPEPLNDLYVRGNGMENGLDMDMILYILQADPWVFLIEDDSTDHLIQRTGMLAVCTNTPSLESIAGPNYQGEAFEFDEIPNI